MQTSRHRLPILSVFLLTLIAILSCTNLFLFFLDAPKSNCIDQQHSSFEDELLSQLVPVPWLLPPREHVYAYQGLHEDIDALLKVQASPQNEITFFFYTAGQIDLLLNALWSLETFGKTKHYIVVALDNTTLRQCLDYNLPCFNGILGSQDFGTKNHGGAFNPAYFYLGWSKYHFADQFVRDNYTYFFADTDLAFVGDVWKFYHEELRVGADMVITEEYQRTRNWRGWNSGSLVFRPTPAVRRFFKELLTKQNMNMTKQGKLDISSWEQDKYAEVLKDKNFSESCNNSTARCEEIRSRGVAPWVSHYPEFAYNRTELCPTYRSVRNRVCHVRIPFVHSMCRKGEEKREFLQSVGLWFLSTCSNYTRCAYKPIWEEFPQRVHKLLPCNGSEILQDRKAIEKANRKR
eukprot:TRINITY_DN26239_c0_g1_i1.p1 TRINITY_DN26239_c0_g1~~TRINITY_DN26239_c0_g1_i1.p1  ORF type:complete len:405 (-),score=24.09 TRINITY_DN26239_c0_g1_i1:4-1218(-)